MSGLILDADGEQPLYTFYIPDLDVLVLSTLA